MHPKEKLPLAYLEHGLKIGSPLTGGNSCGVVKRYTPYVAKHDTRGLPSTAQAYNLPSNNDGKIWNNRE
jgi:hypothetical protein